MRKTAGKTLIAAVAAMLLAAVCALCACSSEPSSHSGETAPPPDNNLPEIKIGVDILEPFFYVGKDGYYVGIDADIAALACQRAGLKPTFVQIPWADRDNYLADGSVDCLWSAFATNGREDDYRWTTSYGDSNLAMLVDSGIPVTSLDDFRGPGGVAVRANSIAEQFFVNGAGISSSDPISVHSYGTFALAQGAFVKGYTDALVGHKVVLDELIAENPDRYRYLDTCLMPMRLAVAFPLDYQGEQFDALNNALEQMKADGSIDAIWAAYEMTDDETASAEAA